MKKEPKNTIIVVLIGAMVACAIIGGPLWLINSVPKAEYRLVKSGEIDKVEYLDKGGYGGVSKTILYFKDGASVSICGTKDVYDTSCVNVYKVQNKICIYDYIESCKY